MAPAITAQANDEDTSLQAHLADPRPVTRFPRFTLPSWAPSSQSRPSTPPRPRSRSPHPYPRQQGTSGSMSIYTYSYVPDLDRSRRRRLRAQTPLAPILTSIHTLPSSPEPPHQPQNHLNEEDLRALRHAGTNPDNDPAYNPWLPENYFDRVDQEETEAYELALAEALHRSLQDGGASTRHKSVDTLPLYENRELDVLCQERPPPPYPTIYHRGSKNEPEAAAEEKQKSKKEILASIFMAGVECVSNFFKAWLALKEQELQMVSGWTPRRKRSRRLSQSQTPYVTAPSTPLLSRAPTATAPSTFPSTTQDSSTPPRRRIRNTHTPRTSPTTTPTTPGQPAPAPRRELHRSPSGTWRRSNPALLPIRILPIDSNTSPSPTPTLSRSSRQRRRALLLRNSSGTEDWVAEPPRPFTTTTTTNGGSNSSSSRRPPSPLPAAAAGTNASGLRRSRTSGSSIHGQLLQEHFSTLLLDDPHQVGYGMIPPGLGLAGWMLG